MESLAEVRSCLVKLPDFKSHVGGNRPAGRFASHALDDLKDRFQQTPKSTLKAEEAPMIGFTARLPLLPAPLQLTSKSTAILPAAPRSPHHGALREPQGHNLSSFWPTYERLIDQKNRSADDDRTRWRKFIEPVLGDTPLEDIRPADVYAMLDLMEDYAPATKRLVLALMRRMWNVALKLDFTRVPNPCRLVELYVPDNTRTQVLTQEDFGRLIACLQSEPNRRLATLVEALAWTGKRKNELRTLLWSSVDLQGGLVTLQATNTKAKRLQVFPLNSRALAVFQEAAAMRVSEWVFPAPSGKYYTDLNRAWRRWRESNGFPGLLLHSLRRTAITLWARSGLSPLVIQRLSGHATLSIVSKYCQLQPEDVRAASEKLCD
jgi:integrase